MFPGGKGANQAVAAARLGGDVTFVCKIGDDIFGKNAVAGFVQEGIHVEGVFTAASLPSGVALITVNGQGQNEIVVASGANAALSEADIQKAAAALETADLVLLQLEIPLATVEYAVHLAKSKGKKVIVNPAPAQPLPKSIYQDLFLITPNETETEILTDIVVKDEASALRAATLLKSWGVANVIVTMGEKGAFVLADGFTGMIPTPQVKAVDTPAAGDVFNGALAVALASGENWQEACQFACKAAAISVTRMGAHASAPTRKEIDEWSARLPG